LRQVRPVFGGAVLDPAGPPPLNPGRDGEEPAMNIGDVAARSGLPAKTIRYYEEVGLIRPRRGANGYRDFGEAEVHKLAFLGRARSLGFSIEECRALLALHDDKARASGDVKQMAETHLSRVDRKIAELEALRGTLAALVERCQGDERPDCPILDDLGGDRVARRAARAPRQIRPAKARAMSNARRSSSTGVSQT
jgi:Cu(I)-responsive transcriptional regulator